VAVRTFDVDHTCVQLMAKADWLLNGRANRPCIRGLIPNEQETEDNDGEQGTTQ